MKPKKFITLSSILTFTALNQNSTILILNSNENYTHCSNFRSNYGNTWGIWSAHIVGSVHIKDGARILVTAIRGRGVSDASITLESPPPAE
jgi:hypothetical protein